MRTGVNTLGQVFLDNFTAARTHLRGVVWINKYHTPTSTFCFVRSVPYQLVPRSITDAFVHATEIVLLHALNIQVLKDDNLEFVYQAPAELMRKVLAPACYPFVDVLDNTLVLSVLGTSLFTSREFSLRFCKFLFVFAEESRILDLLTSAQGRKVDQPKINANNHCRWQQRPWINLTRKICPPVAKRIALAESPPMEDNCDQN